MAGWEGYKDWLKKVNDSGMYFSDYDLERAAADKNYADNAYDIKTGWYAAREAGDKEGQAKYHNDMETLRAGQNYSGGAYGDEYHPWSDGSPQDRPTYTQPAASTRPSWDADGSVAATLSAAQQALQNYGLYNGRFDARIDSALRDIEDYGPYNSRYQPMIDAQLDRVINRGPFEYNLETDPAWQAYRKQYTREGQRSSEDVLGQYAAMTGGMPSTAAMTAAQQAGDYYNAQMTDKIPELYRLAYSMYSDDANRALQNLSALRGLDSDAYGRYSDTYNRMLTGLNALQGQDATEYGRWSDQYNRLAQNLSMERALANDAYGRYRDSVGDWEGDRSFGYNAYLNDLGQWNTDRNFGYNAYQDMIDQYNRDRAFNTERADTGYSRAWDEALAAAQYGDYSKLEALGVTPNSDALLQMTLADNGRTTPVGSGRSGGSGGSGSGSGWINTDDGADSGKWADVEMWVDLYGAKAAEDYIKEHYKDLGYGTQSAALSGWRNHLLEVGGAEESADSQEAPAQPTASVSSAGQNIINDIAWRIAVSGSTDELLQYAINKIDGAGDALTEDDIDAIMRMFGR